MTELYLLNVPFEANYKDTVYFPDVSDQMVYMAEHRVHKPTDDSMYTFQRKDGVIRYPEHIDNLYDCNYVSYKNKNKRMYAFIVDMKYVNDGCTEIYIKTDVIQTWMFDYTVKTSFVEREHVVDDTMGKHTYPEDLEVGDFLVDDSQSIASLTDIAYIVATTKTTTGVNVEGGQYNGMYSGVKYYYFDQHLITQLNDFIKGFDAGHAEAIQCMFVAPLFMVTKDDSLSGAVVGSGTPWSVDIEGVKIGERILSFSDGETDIGFKPKNNKLLTYPYKHLLVTNNSGGEAVYKYELFGANTPRFKLKGVLTPGCSIRLNPYGYKGELNENVIEGLNLGKYPICNWTSDVYTNWLTQNAVNIGVDAVSGVAQLGIGIAGSIMGAGLMGAGGIAGGVTSIGRTVGQIHQMSFTPPQSKGNLNSGDVNTCDNKNTFTFKHMSIKEEYARIIDGFFSMFGYKINMVKKPNENHRESYWYTKTIDVNIDGAIPNKDLDEIKQCYNRGITFWRPYVSMGDYSLSNNITI